MRVRIAPLLLVVAATFVGCQSVKPPIEGRMDPYASPQVSFSSETLRQHTAVLPPTVQRDDAGNLLHVTLPVRNTTNRAFTIDYEVSFLDANGGQLERTGWLPLPLEANSPATIQANSTNSRAADFHVSLRLAK